MTKEAAADVIGQVYNQRKMPHGVKKITQNELSDGATYDAVAAELGVSR